MSLRKRVKSLEFGYNTLCHQKMQNEGVHFTTYTKDGEKYLALYGVGNGGITWSKHFAVKGVVANRGRNSDVIDDNDLFKEEWPI